MKRVAMSRVEEPPAVWLTTLTDDGDSLVDAYIRLHVRGAEVVQRTQHIVAPERRKRELRPHRLDDVAGRQPAEQPTIEEILMRTPSRVRYRGRNAERLLEREQSLDDANRRVERRANRAALRV